MNQLPTPEIRLGGKQLIQWKAFLIACPFLILIVPITENAGGDSWTFWRWTLASIIGMVPVLFMYLIADVFLFHNREKKPVLAFFVFLFGFILGATRGLCITVMASSFKLINEDFTQNLILRTLDSGLKGLLLVPIFSLFGSSLESYKFDRNSLITEKLSIEAKKSESQAVVKSLRASMSQKVDENLLDIVNNSKEFFNQKDRNLEENWELLAERLREAALQSIRPFSHNLHRKGAEKQYSVKISEILKYIAHTINVHIPWVLLIYGVTTYSDLFMHTSWSNALGFIFLRLGIIALIILVMRLLKKLGYFRSLGSFTFLLIVASGIFVSANLQIQEILNVNEISFWDNVANGIWFAAIILIVGLISAFIDGQKAEIEFIQTQLSKSELESRLIQREEARVRRELAKYLHGTIQSRLMSSAVNVERAGRSGDKKKLSEEVAKAYKNLRLPDDLYFSSPEESLKAEIQKVVSKWNDLMTIKVKLDPKLPKLPENVFQEIGSAINEALANSFRHGSATAVSISISLVDTKILINLTDNGSGPVKGKLGLGSEAFSLLAGNSWHLHKNPNGPGATLELSFSTEGLDS